MPSHNHPTSHPQPPHHASEEAKARFASTDSPKPTFDLDPTASPAPNPTHNPTNPTSPTASTASTRRPALLLALSGPSSSGKTTLARLLRNILPNTYILHLDDFYKTDAEIPYRAGTNLQDWDCLESINVPALRGALEHIHTTGAPPPDFVSKEDKNAVGECGIADETVEACRRRVERFFAAPEVSEVWRDRRVAIIDGFLLYSREMAELGVRDLFDVKLFLRTSYGTAKRRREARAGYVTIEGFWEDPPGYVDDIVWPNYVKDHSFLFKDGDVEGQVDERVCQEIGLEVMPKEAGEDMGLCLEWATEAILRNLRAYLEL